MCEQRAMSAVASGAMASGAGNTNTGPRKGMIFSRSCTRIETVAPLLRFERRLKYPDCHIRVSEAFIFTKTALGIVEMT